MTETCDADAPHLITQATTTLAPSPDSSVTTPIQQALERKGLLPGQKIVGHRLCRCRRGGAQSGPGSGPRGPGAT